MTPRKRVQILMRAALIILLIYDIYGVVTYLQKGYLDINIWVFVLLPLLLLLQNDWTFQKNMAHQSRELDEYNLSIDDLIKLIETKFDDAKSAAKKKSDFLSSMSHEIRTPINAILGMNEMIIRESDDEKIVDYALNVRNAGNMLLSLINDILDFSKIESGRMELVPVEYQLSSMINDLVNMTLNRMSGTELEFKMDISPDFPCTVFGDDVRIKQILVNLLTNAVKYTKEGSVTLSISGQQVDNFYRFKYAVTDTGIGIAPENIENLTKEFVRVDLQRNRQIEGTGLGLAITSQLLELMGSELQIESVLGQGSTFSFEVEQKIVDFTPMGEFAMNRDQEKVKYKVSFVAPEASILVVDDTLSNRQILRGLLKETKIKMDEADSGEDCLNLIREKKYQLILMDHMMPGMDGIETLHRIRYSSYHYNTDTPIVVLTANAVTGAKEQYLKEGFDGFLAKPIIPDKLEELVSSFIPEEMKQEVEKTIVSGKKDLSFIDSLPQIAGLDWRYGYSHFEDEAMLLEAVENYYRALPGEIARLQEFLEKIRADEEDSMNRFRIQIHAMKSAANIIGLISLGGNAAILEMAAQEQKKEAIVDATPLFLEAARSYLEKLSACVHEEEKTTITDTDEIRSALLQLKEAVESVEVDVADSIIVYLRGFEYAPEWQELFRKLESAVVDLDADRCDELIEEILTKLN